MLTREKRDDLIGACEATYKAYAALDFAKDKKALLTIDGEQSTLNDFFAKKIKQYEAAGDVQPKTITANINGQAYQLKFARDANGAYQCSMTSSVQPAAAGEFKKMENYTQQEKLNLMCNQSFVVEKDKKGDYALGILLHKSQQTSYQLGGANKMDLYRDHLNTLYKIQKRLAKGETLANILIALATGAGKTFVQAMWLLVLDMANLNGVFALPGRLVKQFIGDVDKLLPSNLTDKISTLEQNNPTENKKAEALLDEWKAADDTEAKFIVASYEELLDKEHPRIKALSSEKKTSNVVFVFDEQHEVMQNEARKLKFLDIAIHHLTMLLTATPTKETYQLCNGNPVARMSNHQKAKAGHGVFPTLVTQRDKSLGDKKSELKKSLSFMEEVWQKVSGLFQSERSSPIVTLMESFQYADPVKFMHTEGADLTDYHQRRWNYQPPTSRKMLVISDDHEELINLHNFVQTTDELGDQRRLGVRIIAEPPFAIHQWHEIREHVKSQDNSTNTLSFFKKNGEWYCLPRYSVAVDGPFKIDNMINSDHLSSLKQLLEKGSRSWDDNIREQIFAIVDKPDCRRLQVIKIHSDEDVPNGFTAGFVRQGGKLHVLDSSGNLQKTLELAPEQLAAFDQITNPPSPPAQARELIKSERAAIAALPGIEFPWGTSLTNEFYARERVQAVYQNGNVLSREKVFLFLNQGDPDVDAKISAEFRKIKEERRTVQNAEAGVSLPAVTLSQQLDRNIFSGMAEYLFSDLTVMDTISLNILRKDDIAVANTLIDQKITEKLAAIRQQCQAQGKTDITDYFEVCVDEFTAKLTYDPNDKKKEKGLDSVGAQQVATILAHMLFGYEKLTAEQKAHFIENWTLENKGRDAILAQEFVMGSFVKYTKEHRVMYVMSGMSETETSVKDNAPFTGFDVTKVKINRREDEHGKKPKARNHGLVEDFDPEAMESQFTPAYLRGVTETISDNYFKFGFIGMYASNKKSEGFSDLNLHTVISTVTDRGGVNNDPAKLIQGPVGRLRGKDPTQKPQSYTAVKKGVDLAFDLERLNKPADYYPVFFEAKRKYSRLALKSVGKQIADNISKYLKEEIDAYDNIENNAYNRGIQLILLTAFREIYNNNNHDMALSKKYFHRALRHANIELQRRVKKSREPYTVKGAMSVLGKVLGGVHKLSYYKKGGAKRKELSAKAVALRKQGAAAPHTAQQAKELLYADIVEKTDYVVLKEKTITFLEIFNLLQKKQNYIEHNVLAMIASKLSDADKVACNKTIKEFFLPLLVKYINPEKQAYCLEQGNKYNNWHTFFIFNRALLEEFANGTPEEQANLAVKIFQKIPSLTYYLNPQADQFPFSPEVVTDILEPLGEQAITAISEGALIDLALYLQGDFLKELQPLFIKKDFLLIKEILSSPDNAKQFAEFLKTNSDQLADNDPEVFQNLFIAFCRDKNFPNQAEINQIKMLDQHGEEAQIELSDALERLDAKMKTNRGAVLTSASYLATANLLHQDEIAEVNENGQNEFLPGMLLFLNDEARREAQEKLSGYDKWHEVLFKLVDDKDFTDFMALDRTDPATANKMAVFFVKVMNATGRVNLGADATRDYKKTCEDASKKIEDSIGNLATFGNIVANPGAVIRGLFDFVKDGGSFTKKQGAQQLANYLKGDFLKHIEPLFYPDNLADIRGILSDHDNCVAFAKFLIDKKEAASKNNQPDDFQSNAAMQYMKEFFQTYQAGKYKDVMDKIKIAPDRFAEAANFLQDKSEAYQADLSAPVNAPLTCFRKHPARAPEVLDTIAPAEIEAVKKIILEKFIPMFLCCVKDENGRHVRIEQACAGYNGWLGLLAKHQKNLEKLNIDNFSTVVFGLLNDIPGLSDLTVGNDGVSITGSIGVLKQQFNRVADLEPPFNATATENLSKLLLANLDKLRYVLFENDWLILKGILLQPGNVDLLAQGLIKKKAFNVEALADVIHEQFSRDPAYNQLHRDATGKMVFIDNMQDISAPQLNGLKNLFVNLYKTATPVEKAQTFKQEVISMLSLNAFSAAMVDSMQLSDANLGVMLSFFEEPAIKAKLPSMLQGVDCTSLKADIVQLVALFKQKDYEKIFDLYFKGDLTTMLDAMMDKMADPNKPAPQFEESKFVRVFALIQQIGAEQIRCHEYFNQAQEKMHSETSWLAPTLSNEMKGVRVDKSAVEHFVMFGLSALQSSMPLNSELSGARNKRETDLLAATASQIVEPLMDSIDQSIELRGLPRTSATPTFAKMRESAQALGERINHLTPMKAVDVNLGSRYSDAIDVLIQPVVGNAQLPSLSVWWLNRMKQVRSARGFYRSSEISDIDHFVNYGDITDNASLMRGYDLTSKFLRSGKNEVFSDYYSDIHELRRQIYSHMVLNTSKKVTVTEPNFYKEMLDDMKRYLSKAAGLPDDTQLAQHRFNSTTFNKIKGIIYNDKLTDCDKLLRIQFLARDFRKDPMRNLRRNASHFFSSKKTEEGVFVHNFCTEFGKSTLHDEKNDMAATRDRHFIKNWLHIKSVVVPAIAPQPGGP